MTTFDDREKAFENRFAHDQELEFRAEARRNRAVALWAAKRLGRSAAAQDDYAAQILTLSLEGGRQAVLAQLLADLAAAPEPVPEAEVVERMDLAFAEAMRAVKSA